MKSRKFFISSALALSTVLGSVGPMMNAMPISATAVSIDKGHTDSYVYYQIFKGTALKNGDNQDNELTNVEWGSHAGENGARILNAFANADQDAYPKIAEQIKPKVNATTDPKTSAAQLAELIGGASGCEMEIARLLNDTFVAGNIQGTAVTSGTTELPDGYYLFKDTKAVGTDTDDVVGLSVLKVADEDIIITPKNDKPTVDKQVYDNDVHDGEAEAGFGETADHEIGETFQFRLKATIPNYEAIENYKEYALTFADTLSKGLTYLGNVKVSIKVGDTGTPTVIYNEGEAAVSNENVTVGNRETDGKGVTTWNLSIADLMKETSITGITGDQKKAPIYVEVLYDAQLNKDAIVHSATEDPATTNSNKVELIYSNNPNAEGTGKTAPDSVFVFTYGLNNKKTDVDGVALKDAEFKLFKGTGASAQYAVFDEDGKFERWANNESDGTAIKSDADGLFKMIGLDAGTYTLKETKAPDGGYKISGNGTTQITITADHNEKSKDAPILNLSQKEGEKDKENMTDGKELGVTIVNSKISNLPETGGMGTTIFYAAAGILAAGAVIALAATKKAKKEED